MILNNKYIVFLIGIILTLTVSVCYGFRINRPVTLTHPLDAEQINKLNSYLEDIYNLQQGEFNLDIVSTTKSGAQNGDIWFIQTGSTVRIQYKANNHIFTLTPDGY